MNEIRNVILGFNCPEKPDAKLFCNRCSSHVIDFTTKTDRELSEAIGKSKGTTCGFFKKSQLSDKFLKYAAATFIGTSLMAPVYGQQTNKSDSTQVTIETAAGNDEEEVFLGMVIEMPAMPVGGFQEFYKTIASKLNYPDGLNAKGRCFVELTIDTLGHISEAKLLKGFDDRADKEAVRVIEELKYLFQPARQRGRPVKSRLVVPITFDPEKRKVGNTPK